MKRWRAQRRRCWWLWMSAFLAVNLLGYRRTVYVVFSMSVPHCPSVRAVGCSPPLLFSSHYYFIFSLLRLPFSSFVVLFILLGTLAGLRVNYQFKFLYFNIFSSYMEIICWFSCFRRAYVFLVMLICCFLWSTFVYLSSPLPRSIFSKEAVPNGK